MTSAPKAGDEATKPVAIVFPAFTRSAADLSGFTSTLGSHGFEATALTLAPKVFPVLYCVKAHLDSIAAEIVQKYSHRRVVLLGHSAGASAATYLASVLSASPVQICGVVFIDGVDSPNRLIAKSLPSLESFPIGAVLAPPSPCNRKGALQKFLAGFPHVQVVVIPGAGHGDIEGGDKKIYRWACRDSSDAVTSKKFTAGVISMASEFARTH